MPDILKPLFEADETSRDHFRSQLKHLINKFIKKFGT